jgi:hypothetical protein
MKLLIQQGEPNNPAARVHLKEFERLSRSGQETVIIPLRG